jgi:hypothetical protein
VKANSRLRKSNEIDGRFGILLFKLSANNCFIKEAIWIRHKENMTLKDRSKSSQKPPKPWHDIEKVRKQNFEK